MAKQVYNEPIDRTVDWGGDGNTGNMPVSGAMVQKFIKDTFNEKFGYCRTVEDVAQFFATEEDAVLYDENPNDNASLLLNKINLPSGGGSTSQQYYVRTENNLENRNFATSAGKACNVMFTYRSQVKISPEMPYEDTGERGHVTISVRLKGRVYEDVAEFYCVSGEMCVFDVSEYLVSGENDVKVSVVGEDTLQTAPALVYTITLTSLSISADNFQWWMPFTEDINIPFSIGGNIEKILKVDVVSEKDSTVKSYEVSLGKTVYIESVYGFVLQHPNESGVYKISAYVQNVNGTIKTDVVEFNIICVSEGEQNKYVAINAVIDELTNWSDNTAFYYTVYDCNKSTSDVTFEVYKDDVLFNSIDNSSVSTGIKNIFNIPLELDTIDNSDFDIVVIVKDTTKNYYEIVFNTDNSLSYSAMPGAVFYMNPKTRNNSQSNKEKVVNEVDGSEYSVVWMNMGWDSDGWSVDEEGNKCLRVYAGSQATIKYKPFEIEANKIGKTIEVDFCIRNVSDESANAINIMDNEIGLNIKPNSVKAYSLISKTESRQSFNIQDSERIRLTYVIVPNAYGNKDFNLCFIYINGVKNRTFVYESNDYFVSDADIVVGCTGADVDVYGIRVYNTALSSAGVLTNMVNWEVSLKDRQAIVEKNDVFDSEGSEIDFYKIKGTLNCFVFTGDVPSYTNKDVKGKGDLEVYWAEHPEWNSIVKNILAEGQGTSSKKYFKWNLRWKFEKDKFDKNGVQTSWATVVEYVDGTTDKGKWRFVPGQPKIKKATAKLNWASSMQSHKIGGVNSITELAELMGIKNEANARITVYQYPFVGFSKTKNEEGDDVYKFLGLYTFGPDKGDDDTFGYDDEIYPDLISVEGADNAPLAALFRVPWKDKIVYDEGEESFQYNGENSWDFNAGSLDKIGSFIDAYNFVYECSPRLLPFDGTLDELNSVIEEYKGSGSDYWLSSENDTVVYYESSEGKFIYADTGKGPISLKEQLINKGYQYQKDTELITENLSDKLTERNQQYISARVDKFRKEMQTYWDLNDSIFARNWTEFNAATDNRAKNTYPYTFNGKVYKWRHDDVDTVWPINNQGQSSKGYWVEIHDLYDNGGPVWNGETSNFWNLLDLAFPEEIIKGAHAYMDAMCELGGVSLGNSYDKLYGFFKKYYFDAAQEYFCQSLYNTTAKELYETGKIAMKKGQYTNDTDPITQSLGDHYSAERRWISKRIPYIMSKYGYGDFSNKGGNSIIVRAAGGIIGYDITPAIWMYPCIATGTSLVQGNRTKPGEVCHIDIDLAGSADQQNEILGANYLEDIGHWHDKNVNGTMSITGKMLTRLNIGSKTEKIVISIDTLSISNTPALKYLMVSRISTLGGTLDLSSCKRLEECYLDGTSITQPKFAVGGGLKKVEFGEYTNYVIFKNMPMLSNDGVSVTSCRKNVTDFAVMDCPNMQPINMLYYLYSSQKNAMRLKRIRCVGVNEHIPDAAIDMLYEMSLGSFNGMDSEGVGTSGIPVFEGNVTVNNAPQRTLDLLAKAYPQLEIECYNIVRPSGYKVNFVSSTSFYENDQIQLVAVSSNSAYPEIKWAIINYGDYAGYLDINENTGFVTLNKPFINETFTGQFEVRAYSEYNPDIYVNKKIYINAIEVSTVGIVTNGILSNGDMVSFVLGPTSHTKPDAVVWTTNDKNVSIDDNGKVNILTDETKIVKIKASYILDDEVYSEKNVLINDSVIATTETNPELLRLAYIANWSSSNKKFLASEAYKVTSLGTSLQNSDIVSFNELVYFGSVISLSDNFKGCTSLKNIIIPEHIENVSRLNTGSIINLDNIEIRCDQFNCYGLSNMTVKNITLHHDVINSEEYPIVGVENLNLNEGVTVSPVVKSSVLSVVNLPSTIIDVLGFGHNTINGIDGSSFDIVFNITEGANAKIEDDCLVNLEGTKIYKCNKLTGDLVVPDNIIYIGNYAYSCCGDIKAHNNIAYIGIRGFYGSNVNIDNIHGAGKYSFEKAILNSDVDNINITGVVEDGAFSYANFVCNSISLNCECSASSFNMCSGTDLNINVNKNIRINNLTSEYNTTVFENSRILYDGTLDDYMKTSGIGLISGLTDLYIGGEKIESVYVPITVTDIAPYAFYGSYITTFTSDHKINIGDRAFRKSRIHSINGVGNVGYYAFRGSDINDIHFNECGVISEYAFSECDKLIRIVMPEGIEYIPYYCFNGCVSLESVELPRTIKEIGNNAFQGCSKLNSFTIKAINAPTTYNNTFGTKSSYMGNSAKNKNLYIPIGASGYDDIYWTNVTDKTKCAFNVNTIYEPVTCTDLIIMADDVPGYDTYTTIYYTAITNGYDPVSNVNVTGYVITGVEQSEDFGQNQSYVDSVEKEISFTYLDKTVTTTIIQGPNSEKYYKLYLNNEWRLNDDITLNPDTSNYDGMYESFSNYFVKNERATMYIELYGYSEFNVLVRSNGEAGYDYVNVSYLDADINDADDSTIYVTTKNNPKGETNISAYTSVTYFNITENEKHRITITYKKDGSGDYYDDRGYVLIPKNQ